MNPSNDHHHARRPRAGLQPVTAVALACCVLLSGRAEARFRARILRVPEQTGRRGATIRLQARMENSGDHRLPDGAALWFFIFDPMTWSRWWVGPVDVGGTARRMRTWASADWTIPEDATVGDHYVWARVWFREPVSKWSPFGVCSVAAAPGDRLADIERVWAQKVLRRGEQTRLWAKIANTEYFSLPESTVVWFRISDPDGSDRVWVGPSHAGAVGPGTNAWVSADWPVPEDLAVGEHVVQARAWADTAISDMSVGRTTDVSYAFQEVSVDILDIEQVEDTAYGESVSFRAQLTNTGDTDLPTETALWFYVAEFGPAASTSVGELAPGETAWFTAEWSLPDNAVRYEYDYWAQAWARSTPSAPSDQLTFQTGGLPDVQIHVHTQVIGQAQANLGKLGSIVVDENNRRAYLTGDLTPSVAVIDTDNLSLTDTLTTTLDEYSEKALFLNTLNDFLYIRTRQSLLYYDPWTETTTAHDVEAPGGLISDPESGRLFVTASPTSIDVFDTSMTFERTINGVYRPDVMTVHDGNLFVANGVENGDPRSGIHMFRGATGRRLYSYRIPEAVTNRPTFLHVTEDKLYVNDRDMGNWTHTESTLAMIDRLSGKAATVSIAQFQGKMATYDGKLYLMTGTFKPGDTPSADAAYGIIEVRDAESGLLLDQFNAGYDTRYFDIDSESGKLFFSSTGSGCVGVVDLDTATLQTNIDVSTVIQEVTVRPSDGHVYLRDRLGGSCLYRVDPTSGRIVNTLATGSWPTSVVLDGAAGKLFVLLHYRAAVAVYDLDSETLAYTIDLDIPPARTDAISIMCMDHEAGLLYAAFPESGWLCVAPADGSGQPMTAVIEGLDPARATGPGLVQMAVNPGAGRLYVLVREEEVLNIHDSNSLELLDTVEFPGLDEKSSGALGLLSYDASGDRLFVGPHIVDPVTGFETGSLPDYARKVIAVSEDGNRVLVWGYSRGGDRSESVVELDPTLTTVNGVWHPQSPRGGPYAAVAADFSRSRLFAAYARNGMLEVFDME